MRKTSCNSDNDSQVVDEAFSPAPSSSWRADRAVALDALNSLLVERNTDEILMVLRVAKEILAAVDSAKHK